MNLTIDIQNKNISLTPKNIIEEIIQNINIIVTTVKGTLPLDRNFGINGKIIDDSSIKGRSKLIISILESIQDFEPRAEVTSVDFINNERSAENGILIPRLEVKIKDEYIS